MSGSTPPGASGADRSAPKPARRRATSSSRAGSTWSGSSRRPRRAAPLLSRGLFARRKIGAKQLTLFTRQLATLIQVTPARRGAAHRLAPGRARGGAPRARQRPCRRGRGPPPLRGDGARAGELPAALPGDGLGRRILGHPAADPRAARQSDGAPGAGARQGALDARLSDHPRHRRRLRRLRIDDLRRAQGGRAVPGYRPVAASADPDRDRPFQLPRRLVVGAAARRSRSASSLPAAR